MEEQLWENHRSELNPTKQYTSRRAETTPLYRLVYHYREKFEYQWEDLFEQKYGTLRACVLESFDRYLNCGVFAHGVARAVCPKCQHSILIPFSCKRRCLCPSCDAKRAVIFGEHLSNKVLLPYPHRHLVFTIPKRIRIFYRFDRGLLSELYSAAWRAIQSRTCNVSLDVKPGAIMALHTSGNLLQFHPHIHAIALDGIMDRVGEFYAESDFDESLLEKEFKTHVFNSLLDKELITQDVIDDMNSWGNSGFSVFVGDRISPFDSERRKFLARYLKKSPLSNRRLELIETPLDLTVRYHDLGSNLSCYKDFSPLEFLAALQVHIPNIWEQTSRHLGCYASRTRGSIPGFTAPISKPLAEPTQEPEQEEKPSSLFASLMKLVFELDPLACEKCGETMEIKAFIVDPNEVARICENLGIQPYRAPPPFNSSTCSNYC